MNKFRRICRTILVPAVTMVLLLSMLAGCGSKEPDAPAATPAPAAATQKTEEVEAQTPAPSEDSADVEPSAGDSPAEDSPVVLTIAIPQEPLVEDYETNQLTQMVEKDNNVKLEWMLLPYSEAETKFSLLVSSNSPLPDILNMWMSMESNYSFGKNGIFIDLTPYYNDPSIAVNFNNNELFSDADREFILANIKSADGKIYSYFEYSPLTWNEDPFRAYINRDWLTNLGLDMPKTTDEFYNVLKAFVEGDPNGTGTQNIIGMLGASGWGQNPVGFLMNAFTYADPDKNYLYLENGRICASYAKPEFLEGLTYMNRLVQDGLLSPLAFTIDDDQYRTFVRADEAVVGVAVSGSVSIFEYEGPYVERVALLPPLAGPAGYRAAPRNPCVPSLIWNITKDCKDPVTAFKVADYFMTDEISLTVQCGIKGVHWTDDPDIINDWVGIEGPTSFIILQDIWGQPGNVTWAGWGPYCQRQAFRNRRGRVKKSDMEIETPSEYIQRIFREEYVPLMPKTAIGNYVQTEDEMEELALLSTAINEYVNTSIVEFIVGNKPLSEYDSFLNELKNIGFDRYIELRQNGYDRSK